MDPNPADTLTSHVSAIRRIARALHGLDAEADDVAQETWVAAHGSPARGGASNEAWLAGIARRVSASRSRTRVRRARRDARAAKHGHAPASGDVVERLEIEALVVRLVGELPAGQRDVLHLRFWEGLPPREIAARLGLGVEAVKSRQKRGLAELRRRLDGDGSVPWRAALFAVPMTSGATSGSTPALAALVGGVSVKVLAWSAMVAVLLIAGLWWRGSADADGPDVAAVTSDAVAPVEPESPTVAPEPAQERRAASDGSPAAATSDSVVVEGIVLDLVDGAADRPAPGVQVTVHSLGLAGLGEEFPTTVTDDEGRFEIDVPMNGRDRRLVNVSAEGDEQRRRTSSEITIEKDGEPVAPVTLRRPLLGELLGRVVDGAGAPLEGVRVAPQDGAVEQRTDEDGWFRFAGYSQWGWLDVELDGWRTVGSTLARSNEDGSWEPVTIVMVQSARLSVRAEGPKGEPLEGVVLVAELATGEPLSEHTTHPGLSGGSTRAVTDEDGIARFDDVVADHGLRVRALGVCSSTPWLDATAEGRLVPNGDGAVLHVPAGEHREFVLRFASSAKLRGRVLDAEGEPLPGATVKLRGTVDDFRSPDYLNGSTRSDEEGRFDIEVHSREQIGEALLSASKSRGVFFDWSDESTPDVASRIIDLASPPEEEIVLRVAPTRSITGVVVDEENAPVEGGLVFLEIPAEARFGNELATGFGARVRIEDGGVFRFFCLPEGDYTVVVEHPDHAEARVEGVAAGTSDVRVALTSERSATVELTIDAPGIEVDQLIVLEGRVRSRPGVTLDAPTLGAATTWTEPGGWPPEQVQLWYGGQPAHFGGVRASLSLTPIEGSTKTLRLDPGTYVFGAKGRAKDGTRLAPVGTGLVRVDAGKHTARIVLTPTSTIRGRVVDAPDGTHVALVNDRGEFVWLAVRRRELAPTSPIGLSGEFVLPQVPIGRYELRAGKREALLGGDAWRRATVDLRVDPEPDVRLGSSDH